MAQQSGVAAASCSTAFREFVMEEVVAPAIEPEATPSFKSRHTVFLSHSGEQKAFVERLCVALEGCFLYPFFDKCDHSLPIGDNFADKISDAIKECHVGVVILSKKFFTSKWPMLELVEMVDEVAKRKGSLDETWSFKIIPVYYSISTEEIDDHENRRQWLLEWEKLAIEKPRGVDVARWQAALDFIRPINGLKYDGVSELRLEKGIVDLICKLVPPEIRLDDTHIQGRDRLCKVIQDKIDGWRKVKMNGVCVVGLYGMSGVGKTSICKVLCNKFFRGFQGRVCHAELGKISEEELMREVVTKLTGTSYERLHGFKVDKMRNVLNDGIIKDAVFLALDDMSDTYTSIIEAKGYLSARLPSGSIVMVTARSLDSLLHLRPYVDKSNCMEMPELKIHEAKALFAKSSSFEPRNEDDEQLLNCCVKQCYFRKDDGKEGYHFHPLALNVLGRQLGCINPKTWIKEFDHIHKIGGDVFNQSRENKHPIFSILRTSFDSLSSEDQMLFMDIGLFIPDYVSVNNVYSSLERTCTLLSRDRSSSSADGAKRWLSMMHRSPGVKDVMSRLERLKSKSLLESLGDGIKTRIGMHDLWRAFCVAETKSGELRCRRWVFETENRSELVQTSPAGTCWENVERMALRRGSDRVNFAHFSNVKVLKISGLRLTETHRVDLSCLCHLKSLEVSGRHLHRLVLQGLSEDLIFISLVPESELVSPSRSWGDQIWRPYSRLNSQQLNRQIGCLKNLQFLWLHGHEGDKLPDMRSMTSMRWAIFSSCENVVKVTGLSSKLTNLRVLDLRGCKKLRSCPGVGDLVNLEELNCKGCERLESLPNLGELRNLRKLEVSGCPLIMEVPGLGELVALEELYAGQIISWHLYDDKPLYTFELPDLCQLRSLRVLHLVRCHLRCCPGVGDLVNLEELNCSRCESLETLPNLENLTKLRKLDISGCPFINEVRGLGELVALEELFAGTDFYDLYYYSYSLNLPNMRKLRNLRVLRLPRCRLEAMPGFERLVSLEEMEADFREVIDRPTALRQPMKLQRLKICGWSLDGLKGLENLAMLRSLDIRYCSGVDELPDFRRLISLKKLIIMNSKVKDVYGLRNLTALENLVIENCEFEDMPGLFNLNTLETLVIKECKKFERVPDLQGVTRLRCLVIVNCPMLKAWDSTLGQVGSNSCMLDDTNVGIDLPNYQRLTGLRTLNLAGCKNLADVTCIGAFSQLENLTCSSLHVEELPDLSNFPRLKYLYLSSCTSLRRLTLSSVKPLSALQLLDLDDCINLHALPDLGMFPALEKLWLDGCSTLTTLRTSERLPALKVLDASGCRSLSQDDIDRLQASCPHCRIHQGLVEWSQLSQYFMGSWFRSQYKRPHLKEKKKMKEEELRSHLRMAHKVDVAPRLPVLEGHLDVPVLFRPKGA